MSEYRRILAHKAGMKAAQEGKPESANNRQRGTIFYDDWSDGYQDGLLATQSTETHSDR